MNVSDGRRNRQNLVQATRMSRELVLALLSENQSLEEADFTTLAIDFDTFVTW